MSKLLRGGTRKDCFMISDNWVCDALEGNEINVEQRSNSTNSRDLMSEMAQFDHLKGGREMRLSWMGE